MADHDYDREAVDEALDRLSDYFGEGFPESCTLKAKGDGIVGQYVRIDPDVDLKTGFAPVDMLVLRAITGVWHTDEGVERARKGTVYSVALMHQTLRNRIDEAMPIGEDEVIAIRRGRVFQSSYNPGQEAVAYDVVLPDRETAEAAETESKATSAKRAGATKAAAKSSAKRGTRKAAAPAEEPF
jgi:hypothetical protein